MFLSLKWFLQSARLQKYKLSKLKFSKKINIKF